MAFSKVRRLISAWYSRRFALSGVRQVPWKIGRNDWQNSRLRFERRETGAQFGHAAFTLGCEIGVGAVAPAVQHVGNVVFACRQALVVQGKAVVLHVVEPDIVRRAATGEDQHGGGDARVGLEDAGGHGDDALQAVLLDQLLAGFDMGVAGAEQHAVGHDDGAASAHLQQAHEEMQEQQLRLFAAHRQGRVDIGGVDGPLERGIGEDHIVRLLFPVGFAERIGVAEVGLCDAVQHQVHAADAQHGHAASRCRSAVRRLSSA